jgi:hypothetical protein
MGRRPRGRAALDHMERPTSALHLTRVTLSLCKLHRATDGHSRPAGAVRLPLSARLSLRRELHVEARPLLGESFEAVRDLRPAIAFVRELSHEQCAGLKVARDSQRPRVDRLESDVGDERRRDILRTVFVAAIRHAGRFAFPLASNTGKNTSLGTVPNAETTFARRTFFASSSAPDKVCAMTRPLSSAHRHEHVMTDLPDRSPACFKTSFAPAIAGRSSSRRSVMMPVAAIGERG